MTETDTTKLPAEDMKSAERAYFGESELFNPTKPKKTEAPQERAELSSNGYLPLELIGYVRDEYDCFGLDEAWFRASGERR